MKNVSYQEKMDFFVNLAKENPDVSLSRYPGYFEDGSAKSYFWNSSKAIVKKCREKEKLTEEELYIIMSHAIIDDLKGKHAFLSRKEKIDTIYDLVLKDPSINFSKCNLNFSDGTQVLGFWNTIQTEIKRNREKDLTEEENYIYYTSACIEDLKKQASLQTLISKFEEFYNYIVQDEKNSVYNKKMKFQDGIYYVHFWNWLQIQMQKNDEKEHLTYEEKITLYYGKKINEVIKSRKKKYLSVLEKTRYLLEYVKSNPLTSLNTVQDVFPDGTSLHILSCNLYRFYKTKQNKPLNEEEQEIMDLYLEIRKIHRQAKLEYQAARVRKLMK